MKVLQQLEKISVEETDILNFCLALLSAVLLVNLTHLRTFEAFYCTILLLWVSGWLKPWKRESIYLIMVCIHIRTSQRLKKCKSELLPDHSFSQSVEVQSAVLLSVGLVYSGQLRERAGRCLGVGWTDHWDSSGTVICRNNAATMPQ